MKQINFGFFDNVRHEFGGSLLKGKRKTSRPLSTKKPLHVILKSSGNNYFHSSSRQIEKIILDSAKEYKIKIYRVTANFSHIHLTLLLPTRKAYLDFIRAVTAAIVRFLSKKKGISLKGLFDLRPYTKILSWGRQMRNMDHYHDINEMESFGIFTRKKKTEEKPLRRY